jgi:hypothetical protein
LLMNGGSDVSKRPSRSNLSRAPNHESSADREKAFCVCMCVSGAWRCRTSARVLAVSTSAARSLCPLSGDDGMRPETKRLSLARSLARAFSLLRARSELSPFLSLSPDPECCCCKNRKLRPPVPHLTFSTRRLVGRSVPCCGTRTKGEISSISLVLKDFVLQKRWSAARSFMVLINWPNAKN